MADQFDILFEPVTIGPVTAPNRFFQVPHCNGMGYRMPKAHAAMRGVKAEGGWGVVCTEEVLIHHSTDLMPYVEGRLWDDRDIPPLRILTDAIHEHGALAGIELTYNGHHAFALYSRTTPFSVTSLGMEHYTPGQTRRMDKSDIKLMRKWHRDAAIRSKEAGFDIVYCYAGHNMPIAMHFLLGRYNDRSDEYGGSLENRVRFLRELIEDTKDAVGDSCGVALRLAVDELIGPDGLQSQEEGREIVAMLAELPDLWDVNVSDWSNDSSTSRFEKEGYQEPYINFVKELTTKPVVGVGRYTSPESMVSLIKRGVMDMVGAARPSIADPFLPNKIKERRFDDIRECIGCNICVTGDLLPTPIRCTQNPTMGEEWRRGWHPERIAEKKSEQTVLVVGAGPAGLECAMALGKRGYEVTLVDGRRELGGRVDLESRLPNLQEWRRVIDWRFTQIEGMENVSAYPESPMKAADILESGIPHVILATGSTWRRDGIGRTHRKPILGHERATVFTPDDLLSGKLPSGRVLIYDDDHFYLGGVLAELLIENGCEVTLATSADRISYWTEYTMEQEKIRHRLYGLGVAMHTEVVLDEIGAESLTFSAAVVGDGLTLPYDGLVLMTDRIPNDALYHDLKPALEDGTLKSLKLIGDAYAPNIIARAVYSGHLAAREFEEKISDSGTPFKIEYVEI